MEPRLPKVQRSKRASAALAAAALCLVAMVLLSANLASSIRSAAVAVLESTEIKQHASQLQTSLKETEAEGRGYVLTGNPVFLQDREASLRRIAHEQTVLQRLLADRPGAQRRLDELSSLIQSRLANSQQAIVLRDSQGLQAAVSHVAAGQGKVIMDQIDRVLVAIEKDEEQVLARRQAQAEKRATDAAVLIVVCLAFGTVLLVVLFRMFRLRERDAAALESYASETVDLYNRAPCGYHSLDEEGVYLAVNDTELEWLGRSREEVIGKLRFVDVLTPASRVRFKDTFPLFKERGEVHDVIFEIVGPDARPRPVLLNATAIRDAGGRFLSTRSTLIDYTDRQSLESALAEARDYAESIVETVPEPLVILTADLRVNSANEAFYRTFAVTPVEIHGQHFTKLLDGVWNVPELISSLERIVPDETMLDYFEIERDFPGIGRRTMLLDARKLHLDGHSAAMTLVAIEDITERRRNEIKREQLNEQLQVRSAELEAANSELEAFSYSVSHDLRAPLRHISGFAQMLERHLGPRANEKDLHYLRTIAGSARQMGVLIDDLLAFSRLGRAEMRVAPVDLNRLVGEVIETLKADAASVETLWKIPQLPTVEADHGLLRQVFANLLSNAVKYTRHTKFPGIEVGVLHDTELEIAMFVRDNGAGFDPKHAGKLFGVFQRLHSAAEFEGTGVGLATVRRIIQRHGGRVWAEGAVGQGATFYFTLPHRPRPVGIQEEETH